MNMFLSLLVTFGVDHRSTSSIMREKETRENEGPFPKVSNIYPENSFGILAMGLHFLMR